MPPKVIKLLDLKLANEISPILNENVNASEIPAFSKKKYWWVCPKGHNFIATASHRSQGSGCGYCSGKQTLTGFNDLVTCFPEIAKEWHPTLNGDVTPDVMFKSSNTKVWWRDEHGHEWEAPVNRRTYYKTGCPVCSNRKILIGFNDLTTTLPYIAQKWNDELNGELKPTHIGKGYAKKVWLHCDNNHLVYVLISNCLDKISCVYCAGKKTLKGFNDIATTHPHLTKFWHPTLNGDKTPENTTRGYQKKVWWTCENGHECLHLIGNRILIGDRCSYCDGKKLIVGENDLFTTHPELVQQWHPTLNGKITPSMVTHGSNLLAWWLCSDCGESWESAVSNRTKERSRKGCATCLGRKIKIGYNDLNSTFPLIAKEIHPTKNNGLTGDQITFGTDKTIWWLCERGHEYKAKIGDRTRKNNGCNICYRLGLPSNAVSFAKTHPELLQEWDHEKNLPITPSVIATFSSKKVWWLCQFGHSWEAIVANRTHHGSGCLVCWKSGNNSLAQKELTDYITKLGVTVEPTTRKYLDGKEIDIYLPDYKYGIEYNGLYWHSEAAGKDDKYHQLKTELAHKNGIELLQVWEDDWETKKEIVLRHIAYKIGKVKELKIIFPEMEDQYLQEFYNNELIVEELNHPETINFLDGNHLQGSIHGDYYFGLKNSSNNLCAILVVDRSVKQNEIIIKRYATKGIIADGFNKLLNYIINNLTPEKIFAISERNIDNGSLYIDHGFCVAENLMPDYMYVKNKKRYNKSDYNLESFENNINLIFHPEKTVKELAEINGFTRIWDSGKTIYVINVADKTQNDRL